MDRAALHVWDIKSGAALFADETECKRGTLTVAADGDTLAVTSWSSLRVYRLGAGPA